MTNKYMKILPTSLVFKEMQIQNHNKTPLQFARMGIITKTDGIKCYGRGKTERFLLCWWECKMVQPLWKSLAIS